MGIWVDGREVFHVGGGRLYYLMATSGVQRGRGLLMENGDLLYLKEGKRRGVTHRKRED